MNTLEQCYTVILLACQTHFSPCKVFEQIFANVISLACQTVTLTMTYCQSNPIITIMARLICYNFLAFKVY